MKSTKQIGDEGESFVCEYLIKKQFKIIDRNWRTRYCEIDIIAEKNNRIYFIEVKTRKSEVFGGGLEYITKKKIAQMEFSAELWVSDQKWSGEYQLAAASVIAGDVDFIDEL